MADNKLIDLNGLSEFYAKLKSTKKTMVVCGDSWSNQKTHPDWPGKVANQLNLHLENQAISGTGWVVGTTFKNQLENATSASDEVAYVFGIGGINDCIAGYGYDVITSSISSFIYAAKSKYPNARIVILPMQTPRNTHSAFGKAYKLSAVLGRNTSQRGVSLLNFTGLLMASTLWDDDGLHPSTYGMEVFTSAILSALNGNSTIPWFQAEAFVKNNITTSFTASRNYFYIENGCIRLDSPQINFTTTSETAVGKTVAIASPSNLLGNCIKNTVVLPAQLDDSVSCICRLNSNALTLYPSTETLPAGAHIVHICSGSFAPVNLGDYPF